MALLSHDDFEARYGDIARRLFAVDQDTWTSDGRPNLIFRRPLEWPVIPLPGALDSYRDREILDDTDEMKSWFGDSRARLFWDSTVARLYRWFFEREVRRLLWAPIFETLAGQGSGSAVVFELRKGLRPLDADKSGRGQYREYPHDWNDVVETLAREPDKWALEDWHAAEGRIDGGLPLDFGDWCQGMGDFVAVCDETVDWALHSWGEVQMSYLTARPALMEQVLDAVGGPEIVGQFFSLECGMNYEFEGATDSFFDFFREPPFVEMPIMPVPWLGYHLKAHPWLDKAFADL